MQDVEIIGLLKTYVKQTLAGMGALKGAACQITSIVDSGTSHVITFSWEDNSGVTHTNTLTLVDGADELDELKDISITNLQDGQVLAWDNTAKKWVNKANSSTVASINNIGDVTVTNVTNGQILEWDDTASKWVNASLGTAAKKDSTNAVTENSTDVVESGAVFTAIDDAVKALDVSDTAVAGSYVTEVSETDGKISVVREAADAAPTESSNKLVKSGGVYSAIDDAVKALDVSDTAVAGSYVTEVSETDGKISVTREAADAAPTENSNKLVKSGGVYSAIDDAVKALDVSDTAVAGSYVTEVSETDGKISVTREAADATPTENSNKLVKSGGVYSAAANIYAEMTRQGVKNILNQQFDEVMTTASLGNKATSANGLTLTYNSDGSIKINGTPTDSSKYVAIRFDWDTNNHPFEISYLAGKKIVVSISETEINGIKIIPGYFDASNVAHQYSGADITTKGEYTYPNDAKWARCYLSISGAYSYSDVTVYPMIYIPFEGATDDYAPPTKTNQQLTQDSVNWEQQNVLGAKNVMPFILSDIKTYNNGGTWNGDSYTMNGVTFTLDLDEKGSLKDVVVDGTATAKSFFTLTNWTDKTEFIGKILNGCTEGSTTTFSIITSYRDSNNQYITDRYQVDNDYVVEDVSGSAILKFMIFVMNGVTISDKKFYPMIRLASIQDDTYVPYSMTNREMTPYVQAISNPNLLDNPWFTVNQRGLSTYSNVNYSYTVDRWLGSSGFDLYVDSDGVSVSSGNKSIFERFEDSLYNFLVGKTVTLSVLKSNGSIVSKSGVVKSNGNSFGYESDSDVSLYLTKDQYANFVQVVFKNTTVKVRAVKLELGTVSTLAQDTAPNYQQELAKCQRYYQVFRATNENDWIALGFASTATSFEVVLPLIVPMRVKPTITMTDCYVTNASQQDVSLSTTNLVQSDANNSKIHLNITPTANLTDVLGPYAFKLIANSGKLALSADL